MTEIKSTVARVVCDPTSEQSIEVRPRLPRFETLDGRTVGLLDISKPRGDVFLDKVEEILSVRGIDIKRYKKPTFTKVAPVDLRHEIAISCDAVIEALAD